MRNATIVQEYKDGGTSPEIARRHGISRQRVWQILRRAGVEAHHKLGPSPAEILTAVRSGRLDTVRGAAERIEGASYSTVRRALRESGEWDGIRAEMREWRRERKQKEARARVLSAYITLTKELGRPATVQEMKERRIYLATIYRAYGKNYVTRLRQDATQGQ